LNFVSVLKKRASDCKGKHCEDRHGG